MLESIRTYIIEKITSNPTKQIIIEENVTNTIEQTVICDNKSDNILLQNVCESANIICYGDNVAIQNSGANSTIMVQNHHPDNLLYNMIPEYKQYTNYNKNTCVQSSGKFSQAITTGDDNCIAGVSGVQSLAYGKYAHGVAAQSIAITNNEQGIAINNGTLSTAIACKAGSVAIACGYQAAAKGVLNSYLVLVERNVNNKIIDIRTVFVDGVTVQPDILYVLYKGNIVKVNTPPSGFRSC